ncbi:hypothetical protein [Streptomyces sp. NPDC051364]|uniref:hypothetical protein n=1 Tax=Streptomyces sp. NPDC051364 TaxID=3155799 RepID=UPI00341C1019
MLASDALPLTPSAPTVPVALNGALATGLTGIHQGRKPVSTMAATGSATGSATGQPLRAIDWDSVGASGVSPASTSLGDRTGWD